MTPLHRILRLTALGLLAGAGQGYCLAASIRLPAAHAAPAGTRYASATYGYSLLLPVGWVRVPNVHWTPLGPRADLTMMPPDHQAALSVIVMPTGKAVYSAAEMQNVALRLISQESSLPTVDVLEGYGRISREVTKTVVINHIPYQTVGAELSYGGHMVCDVQMTVAVTQQHRRLYVVAALVYQTIFGLPPGGGGFPTATPTPGFGMAPRRVAPQRIVPQRIVPAAIATVVPAGPALAPSRDRVADAPIPLPTDRERGNLCRTPDEAGLIFLDKNCAAGADSAATLQAFSTMSIAAHAAADTRPPATVGADGFATYTDAGQGVTVSYPAQWTPVAVSGALGAVQSPDQNALVVLSAQPTDAATLTSADLRPIADQQIAQVGSVVTPPVYNPLKINGAPALLALAAGVGINTGSMVGSAQVSVIVAAAHHRVYVIRAATLLVGSGIVDTTPVHYPYFTPFTALARRAVFDFEPVTGAMFAHKFDLGLAFTTALSLEIDPHVP